MLSFSSSHKKSSVGDFLTTKEASEIVPYSREYIGRLAREKKVPAGLVGGKWMVSASSLLDFYEQAKIEEEVLSVRLSQERLVEQNVADFFSGVKFNSDTIFTPKQKFFVHVISTASVMMVGILFFFSPAILETTNHSAQLFFSQADSVSKSTSFEVVEMTTPINIANGILLLPENGDVAAVDPALLFSDEVEVVEGVDGVMYIRVPDGENFSDIPFVSLPASHQYYRETIISEDEESVF